MRDIKNNKGDYMKEQGNVCLRLKANVSSDVSDPETRIDRVEVRPRRMGELATGFLSLVARVAQYAKFGTVYNNLLDDRTTIESISVLSKQPLDGEERADHRKPSPAEESAAEAIVCRVCEFCPLSISPMSTDSECPDKQRMRTTGVLIGGNE